MKNDRLAAVALCGVLSLAAVLLLASIVSAHPSPAAARAPDSVIPLPRGLPVSSPLTTTSTYTVFTPLILKNAGPPAISCFNANPSSVSPGSSSVLSWCVTSAVSTTISPDVGPVSGTSVSATVHPTWTTAYLLSAFNAFGVITRVTTVTVMGGSPCGNVGAIPAWEGTLGFSFGKSASNADESLSLQRGGNVSFHIEQSGSAPGGVSWIGFATGNVNINDRHEFRSPPPPQVSTLVGSGAPITLVQGIEEHSRVALNVRYSDCSYNFTFDPYVEATETDPNTPPFQIETTVGSIRSSNRAPTYATLSGDTFFSARSLTWPDDGSDAYFPPWPTPGGLFPTEASLGSAHVNWGFTPASP